MLQHALGCGIVFDMSDALKAKIKQRTDFDEPAGEAILNLLVAADTVRRQMDRVFAAYDITMGQYNVLRILRGAGEDGHPRCEIAARMVEHAPDITRLVDRLENQKLAVRDRSAEDRRQSVSKITEQGLELLERIEPGLIELTGQLSQKMSPAEWIALTTLCEKIYVEKKEIG